MDSSSDIILTENCNMLKALYDFQAVYAKTISFGEGEYFILYQTSARQRNWWQVINMKGSIGFVPSNYVTKIKVEPNFLLSFLESSIESLNLSKEATVNGIISRTELIERLKSKKAQIASTVTSSPVDAKAPNKDTNRIANGSIKTKDTNQSPITHDVNSDLSPKIETIHNIQHAQIIHSSPSINSSLGKLDDIPTPTATTTTYDNSVMSDPSEATNTTSDDATTVISKSETNEDASEEDIHSQSMLLDKQRNKQLPIEQSKINDTKENGEEDDGDDEDEDEDDEEDEGETLEVHQSQVYQIIDSIRQSTNLSHELSCVALRVVLSELETIFSTKIVPFLDPIANHLAVPLEAPDEIIEHTHDAQRLRVIFSQLAECKNDSEQRTWMLYEDEDDIMLFLRELIEILGKADKKICKHELRCDQYQSIINLVQYYQMETRWPIRKLLLNAFKALCQIEVTAIEILVTSVLPMELVQDLRSNADHLDRVKDITLMLTMIFSMGQKLPINHQEFFDTELILHLLNSIENPPKSDIHDILPDMTIHLILALNLQYDDFMQNYVLEAMQQIYSAKTFTEKILILLNRQEDPINYFDHSTHLVNPVLKMFVDLFSCPETASLFYSNDNKVLIDILVRQLSDLSPGDSLRRWYLELCRRIVRNTDYAMHSHRKSDLMKIFTRIFCEESECSLKDQQLVREIANEFPQIFKA